MKSFPLNHVWNEWFTKKKNLSRNQRGTFQGYKKVYTVCLPRSLLQFFLTFECFLCVKLEFCLHVSDCESERKSQMTNYCMNVSWQVLVLQNSYPLVTLNEEFCVNYVWECDRSRKMWPLQEGLRVCHTRRYWQYGNFWLYWKLPVRLVRSGKVWQWLLQMYSRLPRCDKSRKKLK